MQATHTLAAFVADTHYTDLPPGLIEDLKLTVLDALNAGVVGAAQPWAQHVVAMVQALGGRRKPRSSGSPGGRTCRAPPWPTGR
jgi:2-methylcitrate dehydratase PrpD